jgi:hypothetical protein
MPSYGPRCDRPVPGLSGGPNSGRRPLELAIDALKKVGSFKPSRPLLMADLMRQPVLGRAAVTRLQSDHDIQMHAKIERTAPRISAYPDPDMILIIYWSPVRSFAFSA